MTRMADWVRVFFAVLSGGGVKGAGGEAGGGEEGVVQSAEGDGGAASHSPGHLPRRQPHAHDPPRPQGAPSAPRVVEQ
eukprot:1187639-Prorocentrum_minimum.AAC.8